jgi:hypothetical protein
MAKSLPNLPTLLLDNNLSGKELRRLLNKVNWPMKSIGEAGYAKNATDPALIQFAGQQKLIFLTADKAIQTIPISVQRVLDHKAALLFVPGNENPASLFSALWLARNEVVELLETQGWPAYLELKTNVPGIAKLLKRQPGFQKPKPVPKQVEKLTKKRKWKAMKPTNEGQTSMFEGLDAPPQDPGAQS